MEYRKQLTPERSLSTSKGIKVTRQKVIVTHNPSEFDHKAIADAYENKFIIPLDFEMLDIALPYYQAGLGNRLSYEITFNNYNRLTKSRVSSPTVPDAKCKITDISLEYEIVTQPDLVRSIRSEYQHMALLYDRILRHRKIIVNKSDTVWNWAFHNLCKSLKGILVLFEEESHMHETRASFTIQKYKSLCNCGR